MIFSAVRVSASSSTNFIICILQLQLFTENMRFCLSNHHLFLLRTIPRYPIIYSKKTLLPFSTATSTTPQPHFMVDFLVQRCGLPVEKANDASKALTRLKTPENPESVLSFLKQSGFNDTHITTLISRTPKLLSVKVDTNLKPKFLFFQELGLHGPTFADITCRYPYFLFYSIENQLQPTISYLKTFFHTNDNIVSAIKKWAKILTYDLQKQIIPSVEVLKRSGVADHQISKLLLGNPFFLTQGPQWVESLVTRVEKLGIGRGSGMLVYAVQAMGKMSEATLEEKLKLLKSFGWSEKDVLVAFRKAPRFINVSEGKCRAVMGVLGGELGFEPCKIALRPTLFCSSLEKMLLPRHEVLKILKSKGLLKKGVNLLSVANMTGETFLKKYVIRYLDRAPELGEAYLVPLGITS